MHERRDGFTQQHMSHEIGPAARVARRDDVVWRADDAFLVVTTVDGDVLEASGSAGLVWDELCTPSTAEELAARIAAAHGIDAADILPDIVPFLRELHGRGFVTAGEAPT